MASNDLIESQNQLRLQNIGCDVIFQIGAKSFPAHRLVLMARMEYFRNMFTADMREKKELVIPFDPLIIDPDVFDDLLNYIYTSDIDFTNENIRAIYKAADYFCFDKLTDKVKEHMKNSLKIETAVLYRNISVEFSLESFESQCDEFIIDNVASEVIQSQLTSSLSFQELRTFTAKLKERQKFEEMFHYSLDWILHDKPNRTGMLLKLLKNIPLESLSFQFLKQNASKQEIILKDMDCLTLLFNAIVTVSEFLHLQNSSDENGSRIESLYAIGGKDEQFLSSVSEYKSTTRRWTATTPMPTKRTHFGCAVVGRRIYVCGGHSGQNLNELTVFDTLTKTWTQLTPMKHARQGCGVAVLNGQIYVAGGYNGTERLAVVERYSVASNRWEEVAFMATKREALELVALNGFLYAIGGWDTSQLDTVERYDPETDQWTAMSNMNNKYNSFGSAVLNGYIYIAKGDKCEVYSPADDKWTRMTAPSKCDFGRRLTVYDGQLYAIGGVVGPLKEWKGSKTMEVLDMQARVWRPEPDMNVARCFHGVAVVEN